jgi:hypothetical protein
MKNGRWKFRNWNNLEENEQKIFAKETAEGKKESPKERASYLWWERSKGHGNAERNEIGLN